MLFYWTTNWLVDWSRTPRLMLYKQRWRHLPLPIEKKVFYVTRYTSRFLMHLGVCGLFCKFCISLVFFTLNHTYKCVGSRRTRVRPNGGQCSFWTTHSRTTGNDFVVIFPLPVWNLKVFFFLFTRYMSPSLSHFFFLGWRLALRFVVFSHYIARGH